MRKDDKLTVVLGLPLLKGTANFGKRKLVEKTFCVFYREQNCC